MKKGTRLQLINGNQRMVAFGSNDDPSVYLTLGEFYTVHSVDVHRWHTKIMLDEMPGRWFNDAHFEEA